MPAERKRCSKEFPTLVPRECPFDAEDGEEFCIFHLPLEKKDPAKFWMHLASYITALLEKAGTQDTQKWAEAHKHHWIFEESDQELVQKYAQQILPDNQWDFAYFIFPEMDKNHSFHKFTFPAVNFGVAQFQGAADFSSARFQGNANFSFAQFQGAADFSYARFHSTAGFFGAQFQGAADFSYVRFQDDADFSRVQFQEYGDFSRVQFQGYVLFWAAEFQGEAYFSSTQFQGTAVFSATQFQADTDFSYARFQAPADFTGARIENLMDFSSIELRNRLLFAGTDFGNDARVLLWNLNFVYGTSDIRMGEGHKQGQIIEPAGQVVFQDIPKGMNQVSFLHTDIMTDRVCVRFSNVKWEREVKEFIFDAKFAFVKNWNTNTLETEIGLPEHIIKTLPRIFVVEALAQEQESGAGKEEGDTDRFKKCEPLIKEDVERIAREIRLFYEKYGNYPDAGDYYIAEMDYKRAKTSKKLVRPFLFWLALSLYKWVSNYGESPSRALAWILGLLGLPWLIIGLIRWQGISQFFNFGGHVLANMIALQSPSQELMHTFGCSLFWVLHKIFGISVITLFLLAIRRRFRR